VSALEWLAADSRWVGWRNETVSGRQTKVPYSPAWSGTAKTDDPLTWGTRTAAQAWAGKMVNGVGGGVGIVLGDLGADLHMAGIDLDTCYANGRFEAWATDVIRRFASYTEISPTGTGAKIFFLLVRDDVAAVRVAMGTEHGRQWKRGNGADHPPAIELYLSNRYFTVTGDGLQDTPDELCVVPVETILWLVREAGPTFAGGAGKSKSGQLDRSAKAHGIGGRLRRAGATFEQFVAAVHADTETAEWARTKGEARGQREFHRIWDKVEPDLDEGVRPPLYSDDDLALRFTARHGDDLRHVATWGKWLLWDETRWTLEETMRTFSFARIICRAASAEVGDPKLAKLAAAIASSKTVAAVVSMARYDRRHAASDKQWDTDLEAINTPNGTIGADGVMRPHSRSDHITKSTAVGPGGECPLWRAFLDKVTKGDKELQLYLQRLAGYCLTGSIKEHALFFFHGSGRNGKGTFLNTLTGIFADYAAVASMDTFVETHNERHPTELAFLRGARLVTAQETEQGRRWAETKIKALTGGDPITARFMRQDFFTFLPQFKLLLAGNHRPSLRGVDIAIRRRFHLVPFTVTISEKEQDPDLPEKLKAEWPGILQWALDGLDEYRSIGLAPPDVVVEATATYLADEDVFTRWLDECCIVETNAECTSKALWESWKAFAEEGNEKAGSRKAFGQLLANHGFEPARAGGGRTRKYLGVRLTII
jgi:putative DNA primase/helicase